ncbi:MAG: DUF305 domain-containing protein [Acidimicrobiia bacterium]|nr:DUF305 domain-containing protein [Acidimicrobiia bacterium]
MLHVWTVERECGPFSSLEGVGGRTGGDGGRRPERRSCLPAQRGVADGALARRLDHVGPRSSVPRQRGLLRAPPATRCSTSADPPIERGQAPIEPQGVAVKRVVGVLVVLAATLTGCGSDNDEPKASDAAEGHNEADVEFAQGMIPHHEQAVDMAQLAAERAEADEVKDLASDIEEAQAPEIETMTGWLENWEEPVEAEGMDMDGGGMMSEDQMSDLESGSGVAFDRQFLEQMTEHHRGAIEMAETEFDDGEFPDALALAEMIRDTQRQEVETMEGLLQQVG